MPRRLRRAGRKPDTTLGIAKAPTRRLADALPRAAHAAPHWPNVAGRDASVTSMASASQATRRAQQVERLTVSAGQGNAGRVACVAKRRAQGASSSGPLARHKPTGNFLRKLPRTPQPHPWHRTSMADRQLFTAAASRPAPSPTRRPPRMVSRSHLSGPRKLRKELSTDYADFIDFQKTRSL